MTDQTQIQDEFQQRLINATSLVDLTLKTAQLTQDDAIHAVSNALKLGLDANDLVNLRTILHSNMSGDSEIFDQEQKEPELVFEDLSSDSMIDNFSKIATKTEELTQLQLKALCIIGLSLGLDPKKIMEFRNTNLLNR